MAKGNEAPSMRRRKFIGMGFLQFAVGPMVIRVDAKVRQVVKSFSQLDQTPRHAHPRHGRSPLWADIQAPCGINAFTVGPQPVVGRLIGRHR
jgi:hypothetical protein